MNPTLSIIIPVYNVAPYLRECLDSVLAQTYAEWEAICVDDGSTDGSGDILDEYAAKDGRIKVVHKINEGVSVARNVGISRSESAWIGFLDADDVLSAHWIECASGIASSHNPDLIRLTLARWDGDGRLPDNGGGGFPQCRRFFSHDEVESWVMREVFRSSYPVLLFVKADLFRKNESCRFPPGMKMCEDTIFLLRLLPYLNKAVQFDFHGYYYRKTEGSVTNRRRRLEEVEAIVSGFLENIKPEIVRKYPDVITPELLSTFFEWMNGFERGERRQDQKLAHLLARADACGLIDERYVSRYYKFGYRGLHRFRTLKVFYLIHTLLLWYKRLFVKGLKG